MQSPGTRQASYYNVPTLGINLVKREGYLNGIKEIVSSSKSSCITIRGNNGVGKTTLLSTLCGDLTQDLGHFVVFRRLKYSEGEKMAFVLAEILFKLKSDIDLYSHWKLDKAAALDVLEGLIKWGKNIFKVPEEIPLEKIPGLLAGIDKEAYERGIVDQFYDVNQKILHNLDEEKKLIFVLDEADRIDRTELGMLDDIVEGLCALPAFQGRVCIILASEKNILSPSTILMAKARKINISNFTEQETAELLRINNLPCDGPFVRQFFGKYGGYPLIQGLALAEMLSDPNFASGSLPESVQEYFGRWVDDVMEIASSKNCSEVILALSAASDCMSLDGLHCVTGLNQFQIQSFLADEKLSRVIMSNNYCYEPFIQLFRKHMYERLRCLSPTECSAMHRRIADCIEKKLIKPAEFENPADIIRAADKRLFHLSLAKSDNLVSELRNSIDVMQSWSNPSRLLHDLGSGYEVSKENGITEDMTFTLKMIGEVSESSGKPDMAKKSYQAMQRIQTDRDY